MQDASAKEGYDLYLLLITNILDSNSTGLIVGNSAKVETAFSVTAVDGTAELAGVVSRKKQVVPPLTKAYEG